jgi:phospholipid/cholesterol/gamma-HCH transport system substrate-binding protein
MTLARGLAIGSLIAAVIAIGVLMFGGGGGEDYVLHMQTANQLVKGNEVKVGGIAVGTVTDISLGKNNEADVKVHINDDFAPLHEGTSTIVRVNSLPSVANRYIALTPGPNNMPEIPGGGVLETDKTTNATDLDQLFNTLDPPTRKGLQRVLQGFATWYAGQSENTSKGFKYLGPSLESFSNVMAELSRDQKVFTDLVLNASRALTAVASRRDDLANLVTNGTAFARGISAENASFSQALALLPSTLRQGSTTFANLRPALADLNQLTDVSKPATKNLAPFLNRFASLLKTMTPTFGDFSRLVRNPGPHNDATDLMRSTTQLEPIARNSVANSVAALKRSQPVVEFLRPYAPDMAAWITHFATVPAYYDANGHYARVLPIFNAFSFDSANNQLNPLAPSERKNVITSLGNRYCPGASTPSAPDGSNPFLDNGKLTSKDCDPNVRPPGP